MKRIGILILVLFSNSCAAGEWNTDWARKNNLSIIEVKVPKESWRFTENFLDTSMINPIAVTVFSIPPEHWDKVLIKYRVNLKAVCFFYETNIIFRMGDYPCLEHELGHFREYLEGVPYHSKYAPSNENWRWFMNP